MEDKLKEKIELSILFDFYGELLKNHNKQIFEDYILNDLSLGEIAEEQGISRQGVYDIVKRCSKQLKDCEEKLSLIKKFEITKIKVNRIKALSKQLKDSMQMKDTQQIMDSDLMKDSDELTGIVEIIELTDNILKEL